MAAEAGLTENIQMWWEQKHLDHILKVESFDLFIISDQRYIM